MLQEFVVGPINPVQTPIDIKWLPPPQQNEKKPPSSVITYYQRATGSANWLSTNIRPDMTQAVNKLCEANANPSTYHLEAMKRLMRYLEGTKSWGIILGGKEFIKEELSL